jgi:SCY1-like protein 1
VKGKILLQAFSRSLHDPFPFARKAGLMGILATSQSFSGDDVAKKIIPHVAPLLMDVEKSFLYF